MIQTAEKLTFTIPLPRAAHQLAERFCQAQSNLQKAEQVYLNTLAVYAVNYHLQCLGFATDWTRSDSWDLVMQSFLNVADLEVRNCGKLECRPTLPNAAVVDIPEEVWDERIGYIAVQLDEFLKEATLLGFTAAASIPEFPIEQLRSLEELPDYLSQFRRSQPVPERVNLNQWLHNLFETGWETIEAIFSPPQSELAFSIRSFPPIPANTPENPPGSVKRGKWLDLQCQGENQRVAIFVGLTPTPSSELDITVEVYPSSGQSYLPPELQVMVLYEEGKSVLHAEAGSSESIEFQFSGNPGESFSVKVALGEFSISEEFLL